MKWWFADPSEDFTGWAESYFPTSVDVQGVSYIFLHRGLAGLKIVSGGIITHPTTGNFPLGFHPHLHILISGCCFHKNGVFLFPGGRYHSHRANIPTQGIKDDSIKRQDQARSNQAIGQQINLTNYFHQHAGWDNYDQLYITSRNRNLLCPERMCV